MSLRAALNEYNTDAAVDRLVVFMNVCRHEGVDFEDVLRRARVAYEQERRDGIDRVFDEETNGH